MKKGDPITVRIAGRTLTGVIELASGGRPMAVLFDEGIPAPFALLGTKQILLLQWEDDRCYEIQDNRPVEIV